MTAAVFALKSAPAFRRQSVDDADRDVDQAGGLEAVA